MSNALSIADLIPDEDGEPRILDTRIGERLGMTRPTNIRNLINRNLNTLQRVGTLLHGKAKSEGGRPGQAYHLNETQSVLVCMWSDAPLAAEVQIEIAQVFVAWRHGRLPAHDAAPVATAILDLDAKLDAKLAPIVACQTRIDDNVVYLRERLDSKDSDFAAEDRRLVLACCAQHFGGMCANDQCGRIVDDGGNALPNCQIDHAFGRQGPQSKTIKNAFPVSRACNLRLRDPVYRQSRFAMFQAFQIYLDQFCAPLLHPPPKLMELSPPPPEVEVPPPEPPPDDALPIPPTSMLDPAPLLETPQQRIIRSMKNMSRREREREWALRDERQSTLLLDC